MSTSKNSRPANSPSGGYSTADGFLGEVSVAERNLLGRGLYGKIGVSYGQYTKGANLSFVDPYFLGYRVALGLDLFYKQQDPTSYVSYGTQTFGFGTRLGFALREDLACKPGIPCIARKSVSSPIWRTATTLTRTSSIPFQRPTSTGHRRPPPIRELRARRTRTAMRTAKRPSP